MGKCQRLQGDRPNPQKCRRQMGAVGLKMAADSAYRVNVGICRASSGQIGPWIPDRQVPPPRGERLVGMSASASGEWLARHRPQAWASWPQALPPAPLHRHGPRRMARAHTMAGVVQLLTGATSRPNPKHSSTGWGRCRYRPPPQIRQPWPTLRFMHKICREI